ncbi:MAG: histidine kinase [Butyrivibrio sp.]|jgi:signal transduction histidine kinase|nr:histidine kinase [Butyrivibrio sp.]
MGELINRMLILTGALMLSLTQGRITMSVIAFLVGLILTVSGMKTEDKRVRTALLILFAAGIYLLPVFSCFLPLMGYELALLQIRRGRSPAAEWLLAAAAVWPAVRQMQDNPICLVLCLLLMAMAVRMAYMDQQGRELSQKLMQTRDSDTELNLALQDKNRMLMESRENEVRMATLQERNRIAREIHDHVGHMLTRSILQMGALQTVHQEQPLHAQLTEVSVTLNQAMNSIRESVHDLHDESVDIKLSIQDALQQLQGRCHVIFEDEMSGYIPKEVRYCFIATVKEAVSNIIRHSDASQVHVMLREHPVLYQLVIEDNGKTGMQAPLTEGQMSGMGLQNMRDRVESLHGHIRIDSENGFRIFISIPKQRAEQEKMV